MKQYTADNIRNIALAGHGSDGKTSLAEAMLYVAGATDRLGSVADGNSVCDFDQEEIKRRISVSSAVANFEYDGVKVNVLDTPGLFDFAGGLYEGVRAADTVVITLSAKSGVLVGTEKAWKLAKTCHKTRAFFVTKMDQENADFYKTFDQLKEKFGTSVCPVIIPVGEVYVNMFTKKAYKFDAKGKAIETEVPNDSRIEELEDALAEAIAETDDELMDKYFSGEPFTEEECIRGLESGLEKHTIAPVYCGDALTLRGISLFMSSLKKVFPSAKAIAGERVVDAEGNEVKVECDPSCRLCIQNRRRPLRRQAFLRKSRCGNPRFRQHSRCSENRLPGASRQNGLCLRQTAGSR